MRDDRMFHGGLFPRGPRRGSSLQKGDLKYVILDLLKERPRHGYDIILELEEKSHRFYKPSPGVIYPTLQLLEEMGYTNSTVQEGKRIYSITEEGDQFLAQKSTVADGVRSKMNREWNLGSAGKVTEMMDEYRAIGQILNRGFRNIND